MLQIRWRKKIFLLKKYNGDRNMARKKGLIKKIKFKRIFFLKTREKGSHPWSKGTYSINGITQFFLDDGLLFCFSDTNFNLS